MGTDRIPIVLAVALTAGLSLVVSAPVALAQCTATDPTCLTEVADSVKDAVDDTVEEVTGTIDDTADTAEETVAPTMDAVTGTIGGTLDPGQSGPGGDDGSSVWPGSGWERPSDPSGSTEERQESPGRDSAPPPLNDGRLLGAIDALLLPGVPVSIPPVSAEEGLPTRTGNMNLLERIGGAAAELAEQIGFPLALAGIVVLFLMAQNRLDRKDPKFALAPIQPDVMRFA